MHTSNTDLYTLDAWHHFYPILLFNTSQTIPILKKKKYTPPLDERLTCMLQQWRNSRWLSLQTEKAMAPHSSTLAWKIPWTEEPRRLQSMGSLRVGHDWATSLSLFTFMDWRRKWQPTPVFLPGESQGRGSLVGCRLWGRTESDTTEVTLKRQHLYRPFAIDNLMDGWW